MATDTSSTTRNTFSLQILARFLQQIDSTQIPTDSFKLILRTTEELKTTFSSQSARIWFLQQKNCQSISLLDCASELGKNLLSLQLANCRLKDSSFFHWKLAGRKITTILQKLPQTASSPSETSLADRKLSDEDVSSSVGEINTVLGSPSMVQTAQDQIRTSWAWQSRDNATLCDVLRRLSHQEKGQPGKHRARLGTSSPKSNPSGFSVWTRCRQKAQAMSRAPRSKAGLVWSSDQSVSRLRGCQCGSCTARVGCTPGTSKIECQTLWTEGARQAQSRPAQSPHCAEAAERHQLSKECRQLSAHGYHRYLARRTEYHFRAKNPAIQVTVVTKETEAETSFANLQWLSIWFSEQQLPCRMFSCTKSLCQNQELSQTPDIFQLQICMLINHT